MAHTSKTRIKDMSIDPNSVKLPDTYKIDIHSSPSETSTPTTTPDNGGFETLVDRIQKKKPKKAPLFRQSHHRGHGRISNWVCVKHLLTNEVIRVRRKDAETTLIPSGKYQYTNKTEWRAFVRSQQHQTAQAVQKEAQPKRQQHRQRRTS